MTTRVLLADDHPVFRDGLRFTLSQADDLDVAGEAADGAEAVRMAAATPYDVVVMDVRMPGTDGVAATRDVVATGAKVLMLTMFEDDATVMSAMRAGASGYLLKGSDAEQVVSAVRSVAAGHAVFGADVAAWMRRQFESEPSTGPVEDLGLSPREEEVLALLADGLTNAEIGAQLFISPITVRNHVSRILAKLQVRDRREAMVRLRDGQASRSGRTL
jgi:DNA-binding NarL/FixJ family response regulator